MLVELANAHRALIERAERTDGQNPATVLSLGASVTSYFEQASSLFALNRFLDETVLDELLAERCGLAADLELLQNLCEANPESPDLEPLAIALRGRIADLLAREDRVFYRPLLRVSVSSVETLDSLSEEVPHDPETAHPNGE